MCGVDIAAQDVQRENARQYDQEHVFRFWESLDEDARKALLEDLGRVEYPLMERLIRNWVLDTPEPEKFDRIEPIPVIPKIEADRQDAMEALAAGEDALRAGRVGLFLVAGGQGTRLGYDGPKGAYPIGPISKKSLFQYHAEKIRNLQRKYDCKLPWYIMVSDTNETATKQFFEDHAHFGLNAHDIMFLKQRMVPCVDEQGKFMLDQPGRLAMNPNGHGGCLPAMVECGVVEDARNRGVDMLSYFQVDNWAVKVVDPHFVGYHASHNAGMSSKNHRKNDPREAVGVHCLCDGTYRVIEYTELDIYPQLLETDASGGCVHFAGNPAIHIIGVEFAQQVYDRFDEFPWHRAHKKIPYINETGERVKPDAPNGYKFETFVFDALQFISHDPVALEIQRAGEYTPIKQFEGANSVVAARQSMADYWGKWLETAGYNVPCNDVGHVDINIEISPAYAYSEEEFVSRAANSQYTLAEGLYLDEEGRQHT